MKRTIYIDLLFYHLKLRAFVAIDLKVEDFKPEFAGKMNFYLSAIDDQLRHADDQSSIGIILCKARDKVTVEYALRDTRKPIGVSKYRLTSALPKELKSSLPTIQQLERELKSALANRWPLTPKHPCLTTIPNNFPKLHNAAWPGVVGKGRAASRRSIWIRCSI